MLDFSGFYEASLYLKMRTFTLILLLSLTLLGHVLTKTKKASKKDIAAYKAAHQKWLDLYKYKPSKEDDKKKKGVKEQTVPQTPDNAPLQQQQVAAQQPQQQQKQHNSGPKANKANSYEEKKTDSKKKKPE